MRPKSVVLDEINAELPPLDWRQGAIDYLARFFARHTRAAIEDFVFTKPLGAVTPEDPAGSLGEAVHYLSNFAASIQLLSLPRGARVLDVACGGGWFTHWLRKLGYDARGMDLSSAFVDLARRRLELDPHLPADLADIDNVFQVHDFEAEPLPDNLRGGFDAIVLESCLHHFFDPIAAMTHVREGLCDTGVVLILEGENRRGPIAEAYMQVMRDTATLERPYPRELLLEVLEHAGLPHVEWLGLVPGFVAQSAAVAPHMTEHLAASAAGSNICVCAANAGALQRIVPTYIPAGEAPVPEAAPPAAPLPPAGGAPSRAPFAGWIRRLLR